VPLGGCPGEVPLDSGGVAAYMAAHPLPANGSYVLVADGPDAGATARAAGGAFLGMTDCALLGGCSGFVSLDAGGFADYTAAHPLPADGTVLEGLPSQDTWVVLGGERQLTAASSAAVAVNDASLDGIPIAPPATTGAGTTTPPTPPPAPRGHRRRLRVKMALKWQWNHGRTELVYLKVGHHPRTATITVSCRGRGCPHPALAADDHRVRRALVVLDGRIYRAGDRLMITLRARGYELERIAVRIRNGRIPKARLL